MYQRERAGSRTKPHGIIYFLKHFKGQNYAWDVPFYYISRNVKVQRKASFA